MLRGLVSLVTVRHWSLVGTLYTPGVPEAAVVDCVGEGGGGGGGGASEGVGPGGVKLGDGAVAPGEGIQMVVAVDREAQASGFSHMI